MRLRKISNLLFIEACLLTGALILFLHVLLFRFLLILFPEIPARYTGKKRQQRFPPCSDYLLYHRQRLNPL